MQSHAGSSRLVLRRSVRLATAARSWLERLQVGLTVLVEPGDWTDPLLRVAELRVALLQQADAALVRGRAILRARSSRPPGRGRSCSELGQGLLKG